MFEQDALKIIRETLNSPVKPLALYLFGSRSQRTARPDSDYDLLAVVDEPTSLRDRITLSSLWRSQLAKKGLDADILVKTPFEIEEYRTKIGSLIHDALRTGIAL